MRGTILVLFFLSFNFEKQSTFTMKIIFNKIRAYREQYLVQMVEWTKPYYTRWFKSNTEAWCHNRYSLKKFPPKTLGRALGDFLIKEDLELLPKLEDHDVLHVLFKYKTTVVDEARMQFFLLGNRKRSLYALCTAIISIIVVPEHIQDFIREFQVGRKCRSIAKWDFRYLLNEPIDSLRDLIYQKKSVEEAPFLF